MTQGTLTTKDLQNHKIDIRLQVWNELRKVALPDSRFHWDFAEFIADFEGSNNCTNMILNSDFFQDLIKKHDEDNKNNLIFVTPDNCLESLRYELLKNNIPFLMTTYGIRRGFYIVDPKKINKDLYLYASTLDGMEKLAKHVTLKDLKDLNIFVTLMITGTGAINDKGIRFGKGHGYFDLEWAMLSMINCIDVNKTKCLAVVHGCQLLEGIELKPEIFDTVCDYVVTNSKIIEVENAKKPNCGVLWDMLSPGMMENIEPLSELYEMTN
jgi:5-formyltetrahydrofolate cyclo-ligase